MTLITNELLTIIIIMNSEYLEYIMVRIVY